MVSETLRAWALGLRALAELNHADEVSMVIDGTAITWDDELTVITADGRTLTVPAEALDDERWQVAE